LIKQLIYLIYLIFALVPAFIWLLFYFLKDAHPEPKRMVLKIFLTGMLAAYVAAVFEMAVSKFLPGKSFLITTLEWFLLVAPVEELLKYLAVKIYVFSSSELDEPFDIMLYMAISALGFAALENIILFFTAERPYAIAAAFGITIWRFFGAVFLHTLTSATLGFFIAMSFYSMKNKKMLFATGFLIAVVFHGFYNFATVQLFGFWHNFIPAAIIIILLVFTTFGFIKLKKLKSICKLALVKSK